MSGDADEKSVNLAEILTDGQMVWIPTKEESLSGRDFPGRIPGRRDRYGADQYQYRFRI